MPDEPTPPDELTPAQLDALRTIRYQIGVVLHDQLAGALRCTNAEALDHLWALERRGLVEPTLWRITPEGRELAARMAP